jgi:hypothetical protein
VLAQVPHLVPLLLALLTAPAFAQQPPGRLRASPTARRRRPRARLHAILAQPAGHNEENPQAPSSSYTTSPTPTCIPSEPLTHDSFDLDFKLLQCQALGWKDRHLGRFAVN